MAGPVGKSRDKLHATVVAAFEERILSGVLAVGDRMPSEAQIAEEFGISTRSVREAMQVLETKGLVQRRHGERAVVVRDDIDVFLGSLTANLRGMFEREADYLDGLMDVRAMFEERAVGILAKRDVTLGPAIAGALDQMRDAVEARDFQRYAEADAAFHRAVVDAVGNEILSSLYHNLYALITEIIRVSVRVPSKSMEEGLEEHRALLAAINSGSAEAAQQAIRAHLEQSRSYLERALAGRKTEGPDNAGI